MYVIWSHSEVVIDYEGSITRPDQTRPLPDQTRLDHHQTITIRHAKGEMYVIWSHSEVVIDYEGSITRPDQTIIRPLHSQTLTANQVLVIGFFLLLNFRDKLVGKRSEQTRN
jgi:3-deoxy-D-arabino-heptulosonate 7-phosphate (DAHP) synthase class II